MCTCVRKMQYHFEEHPCYGYEGTWVINRQNMLSGLRNICYQFGTCYQDERTCHQFEEHVLSCAEHVISLKEFCYHCDNHVLVYNETVIIMDFWEMLFSVI